MPAACSKKEEKEGTAEKDGAPKWIKTKEREIGGVAEPFEQHFVNIPGNRVKGKQPVFVPRFVAHVRDVKIAEIEDRMEPREIISGSQQRRG